MWLLAWVFLLVASVYTYYLDGWDDKAHHIDLHSVCFPTGFWPKKQLTYQLTSSYGSFISNISQRSSPSTTWHWQQYCVLYSEWLWCITEEVKNRLEFQKITWSWNYSAKVLLFILMKYQVLMITKSKWVQLILESVVPYLWQLPQLQCCQKVQVPCNVTRMGLSLVLFLHYPRSVQSSSGGTSLWKLVKSCLLISCYHILQYVMIILPMHHKTFLCILTQEWFSQVHQNTPQPISRIYEGYDCLMFCTLAGSLCGSSSPTGEMILGGKQLQDGFHWSQDFLKPKPRSIHEKEWCRRNLMCLKESPWTSMTTVRPAICVLTSLVIISSNTNTEAKKCSTGMVSGSHLPG